MTKHLTRSLLGSAPVLRSSHRRASLSHLVYRGSAMLRTWLPLLLVFGMLLGFSPQSRAQSITSGDVTGTVSDPSGARIAGATVVLTSMATNSSQRSISNSDGSYRFAFVTSGVYKLEVSASGFQTQDHPGVIVTAGQPTAINMQLTVAGALQSVEVVEAASSLETENADVSTNVNTQMIDNLPNPGADLTYFAQTAPGVVMNTQSGYGNFSALGMPGNSNLFSINGMNYNDPFLILNNSGASNLTLGANDIAEANVINNGYSGQYGQYAGTQVTYISKSGSNEFHGDAIYNWNGRALNANQFFNNEVGAPTPFNNFNQWATGVHGPIVKNRTFFDVDYEGLRNLLPGNAVLTQIPSPQFQTATLQNLVATGNGAESGFYEQLFKVYNGARGAASATPVTSDGDGGCGGQTFTGLAVGAPCALQFRTTPPSVNREYLWSARVDHTFSDKDRGYIRILRDNGFQPTFTSPFGPTFNDSSTQPQMSGQVSETHTFGPNTVNQFSGSVLYYSAIFRPSDPSGALAALPTFMNFAGGAFSPVGAWAATPTEYFPNGRRVFQYQVSDDLSKIIGKHTLRVGFSWLHQTVTDLDFESLAGLIHGMVTTNLTDFFNGGGPSTSLFQGFPSSPEEGIRFNTIGGYVADDWKATDRLNISFNLRLENYSNPSCDANCFSRLSTAFTGAANPNGVSTPYNQFIISGQHNAFPNTKAIVWEPRIGIAWRPFKNDKTVVRTGAGIFADELPGGLAEGAAFNAPNLNAFAIPNGPIAPGVPGSLFTTAAAANQALLAQFKSGGSFNSISQSVPGFAAPNFVSFPNTFLQPTYYKWNFEIEQSFGTKTVLTVNYAGMHGVHLPIADAGLNGYCPTSVCTDGFAGLPATPANGALGTVTQYTNANVASYNGLIVSLQRRLAAGLTFNLNYTWSHALDESSNGGIANAYYSYNATNISFQEPENPYNFRSNYGSADYDVRHYFSANFVLTDMFRHAGFKWGPNPVFGGWTLASNWFLRSGLPFSVVDNQAYGTLFGYNYNGVIFATPAGSVPKSCPSAENSPCINTSQFLPGASVTGFPTGFGTMGRNSLYGPHFFNVDISLMKDIRIKERLTFSFGAQAYNAFNHTNLDNPVDDISNPQFGRTIETVSPPTTLLGSFVGAGSSPRFVEIKGVIRF
jgi:hypothetical protein